MKTRRYSSEVIGCWMPMAGLIFCERLSGGLSKIPSKIPTKEGWRQEKTGHTIGNSLRRKKNQKEKMNWVIRWRFSKPRAMLCRDLASMHHLRATACGKYVIKCIYDRKELQFFCERLQCFSVTGMKLWQNDNSSVSEHTAYDMLLLLAISTE